MRYSIYLKNGLYEDYFLDGFIPTRVFDLMKANIASELGFCEKCDLATKCHICKKIIGEESYEILCPILFYDVIKPRWTLSEII